MDINIEQPIWNSKSVGLNLSGLHANEFVCIRITYKNKQKQFVYPYVYKNRVHELIAKSSNTLKKKDTTLHIVPIASLTVSDELQKD